MIRRGEIYWVQLDPTVGAEIKKTRPALVVSNDNNNRFSDLITVLPITSQAKTARLFEVLIPMGQGGLKKISKAKANQIRTVDKSRFGDEPLGFALDQKLMAQADQAIKIHLALN